MTGGERWPGEVQNSVSRGLGEWLVADEHSEPEGAVEHVDHDFAVEIGPELAPLDPVGDRCRCVLASVGEEAISELGCYFGVALGAGYEFSHDGAYG